MTQEQAEFRLKATFGFSSFYDGQWDIISRLLNKEKVLFVEKTGFGKSLCFQFPATCFDGITIVFSPLIALMRDQVNKMKQLGIPAEMYNSQVGQEEKRIVLEKIKSNQIKLVYISPERLDDRDWIDIKKWAKISMIVVDEAHCISTWGHDFRPNYRHLGSLIQNCSHLPILATTATANDHVCEDIKKQIGYDLIHIQKPLIRENISLRVVPFHETRKSLSTIRKKDWLYDYLQEKRKNKEFGIIYTGTKIKAEYYSSFFTKQRFRTAFYHAGMDEDASKDREIRNEIEKKVMGNELDFIFSTNALGMGIDKPDIRFIIHDQIPGSPISYYQEVGRAGRDRNPSDAILLFNPNFDIQLQKFFIALSAPDLPFYTLVFNILKKNRQIHINTLVQNAEYLRLIKETLYQDSDEVWESILKEKSYYMVNRVLADLIEQKLVERQSKNFITYLGTADSRYDSEPILEVRKIKKQQLQDMLVYVDLKSCRMTYLCNYLNDKTSILCGSCDNCLKEKGISVPSYKPLSLFEAEKHPIQNSITPPTIQGYVAKNLYLNVKRILGSKTEGMFQSKASWLADYLANKKMLNQYGIIFTKDDTIASMYLTHYETMKNSLFLYDKLSNEKKQEFCRKNLLGSYDFIFLSDLKHYTKGSKEVQFIVHTYLPDSIKEYFQDIEFVRSKSKKCEAILVYPEKDILQNKVIVNSEVLKYAKLTTCRMEYISSRLLTKTINHCGSCDNCANTPTTYHEEIEISNIPKKFNVEIKSKETQTLQPNQEQYTLDEAEFYLNPQYSSNEEFVEHLSSQNSYHLPPKSLENEVKENFRHQSVEELDIQDSMDRTNSDFILNEVKNDTRPQPPMYEIIDEWHINNLFGKNSSFKILLSLVILSFIEEKKLCLTQEDFISRLSEICNTIHNESPICNAKFFLDDKTTNMFNQFLKEFNEVQTRITSIEKIWRMFVDGSLRFYNVSDTMKVNRPYFLLHKNCNEFVINSDLYECFEYYGFDRLKLELKQKLILNYTKHHEDKYSIDFKSLLIQASMNINVEVDFKTTLYAIQRGNCFLCGEPLDNRTNTKSTVVVRKMVEYRNDDNLWNYFLCHQECDKSRKTYNLSDKYLFQWQQHMLLLSMFDQFFSEYEGMPDWNTPKKDKKKIIYQNLESFYVQMKNRWVHPNYKHSIYPDSYMNIFLDN